MEISFDIDIHFEKSLRKKDYDRIVDDFESLWGGKVIRSKSGSQSASKRLFSKSRVKAAISRNSYLSIQIESEVQTDKLPSQTENALKAIEKVLQSDSSTNPKNTEISITIQASTKENIPAILINTNKISEMRKHLDMDIEESSLAIDIRTKPGKHGDMLMFFPSEKTGGNLILFAGEDTKKFDVSIFGKLYLEKYQEILRIVNYLEAKANDK